MAKITAAKEKQLRSLATPRGALGYGTWLSEQAQTEAKSKRAAEAAGDQRRLPSYGVSGEALYGSAAADDGYAAYLQAAAKEARAARAEARQRESVAEGRAAVAGYAAYLDGLRQRDGDRLVSAANSLLELPANAIGRRDETVTGTTADPKARAILRGIHAAGSGEYDDIDGRLNQTLIYISNNGFDYDKAYEYCRMLGYDTARASAIANYAMKNKDSIYQEMVDLFDE